MNTGFVGWATTAPRQGQAKIYETTAGFVGNSLTVPLPAGGALALIAFVGRGDTAATNVNMTLQLNGDTGSNYDYEVESSNVSSNSAAGANILLGRISAATAPTGAPGTCLLWLADYNDTNFMKCAQFFTTVKVSNTAGNVGYDRGVGYWRSTAAITSATFTTASGNFAAGSVWRVYVWS